MDNQDTTGKSEEDYLKNKLYTLNKTDDTISDDERIHQAQETYLGIINSVTESIYIQDEEGVFLDVNNAAINSYGLTREDLIGKTPEILSAEGKNDLPLIAQMIKKAFNGEPQRFEFWGKRADGTVFPDEVTLTKGVYFGKNVVIALVRNIAERKKAEQTLRQSEEKYRKLAENISDVVWTTDLNFNLTYVSPSIEKLVGATPEEQMRKPLSQRHPPESIKIIAKELQEGLKLAKDPNGDKQISKTLTVQQYRCDDSLIWVSVNASFVDDGKGNIIGLQGVTRDITEQKQAELALRESEARFQLSMEATKDGLWDWNVKTREAYYSPAYYKMLGYEYGDFATSSAQWKELVHPDDLERIKKEHIKCVNGISDNFDIEFRMKSSGGEWKWIYSRGSVVERDNSNNAIRIVGTHVDITDRKQADEKIRQAHETYLGIINSITESIYVMDGQGVFLDVNKTALDHYGLKKQDIIGKTPGILSARGRNDLKQLPHTIKKAFHGEPQRLEFWGRKSDGAIFPTDVTFSPGIYFGKKAVIAVARDITDRKKAEMELVKRESLLNKIFDVLPIGLWFADEKGKLQKGNPAGVKIWGAEPTVPMEEYGVFKARHLPSGKEITPKEWALAKTIKYGKTITDELIEIDAFDGKKRVILNYTAPVFDNEGKMLGAIVVNNDITELHYAENHNRLLASIIERSNDFIGVADTNQKAMFVNRAGQEMLGIDGDDAVRATKIEEYFLPEDLPFVRKHIIPTLNKQGRWAGEFRFRHFKTGKPIPVLYELFKTINQDTGEVTNISTVSRDISEIKQAEENIRQSQQLLQSISDNMFDLVALTDLEGNYTFVGASHKILGYAKEELMGTNVMDYVHPGDLQIVMAAFQEFIANKEDARKVDYRNRCADGSYLWFETVGRFICDEKGKPMQILFNSRDITDRKKADEALRESEERFRSLFENATIGIYRTTPHGKILMANPALVKMLGYSSFDELEKKNISLVGFDPSNPGDLFQQQIKEKGEIRAMESAWRIKDGSTIFVSESARAFRDEKGDIVYYEGTVEDITYRKQAEEIQKELEIANKTTRFKQNFLANMSHEIRTPLTGVLGMIEIMEQTSLTYDQRDYLNTIKTSGENLREIINQVLDYSKIEAGRVSIHPRVFEFTSLPVSAMSLYKNNVRAGVTFQSFIDPKIPAWIEADNVRLSQVLNNLVSNAVKFTPYGSITIQSFMVSSDPGNGQIVIKVEVTDTGPGIPDDLQNKLFVPFSQIEAIDIRDYEGTGLGLSICRQLIKMLGGETGVISEVGKGSTFWFTFPATIAKKPELPGQHKNAALVTKNLHILLVEDKQVNQKVVKLMLASLGHEVTIASNGQEAIQQYRPGRFDLILMDIQMPVMDGVKATQFLRKKYTNLPPIVGLSANAFEGDREKYMTLGMDEYLTKPVKKEDFEELIGKLNL